MCNWDEVLKYHSSVFINITNLYFHETCGTKGVSDTLRIMWDEIIKTFFENIAREMIIDIKTLYIPLSRD